MQSAKAYNEPHQQQRETPVIAHPPLILLLSLASAIGSSSPSLLAPRSTLQQQAAEVAQGFTLPLPNRPDFFEQGREQFEQEVDRLERSPRPHPALTIKTDAQQWQPFVFREAGASVWLPLGILSQEEKTLETAVGPLTFQGLSAQTERFKFVAAYTELANLEQRANPDRLLRTVQAAIEQRTEFELSHDRSIRLDGYSGREFQLQGDDEIIVFRIYLVDRTLYVLAANQREIAIADASSEAIAIFLDSFELLDQP